jgi:hypothetical protein
VGGGIDLVATLALHRWMISFPVHGNEFVEHNHLASHAEDTA